MKAASDIYTATPGKRSRPCLDFGFQHSQKIRGRILGLAGLKFAVETLDRVVKVTADIKRAFKTYSGLRNTV